MDVCRSRALPQPLIDESVQKTNIIQGRLDFLKECRETKKLPKHSIAWIKRKKERARKQMKDVANDSKYTGRKRRPNF